MDVPALTINKVCLSGIDAIALADQLIRAGEFDVVVAGGMESMTNAPHLLVGSREGVKYGNWQMLDSMAHDALFCAFDECAMGESTEKYNERYALTREEQDAFSARSHQRAAAAADKFAEEIAPVAVPQRKGDPVMVTTDDGVRPDTTVESLSKLRPAFAKDGTITAGSASQISDGAAAVVVMSKAKAEELGPHLARGDRRARRRRRARTRRCRSSPPTRSSRPAPARASPSPTSTSSSSTRRSPPSASCPPACWASATTSST